MANVEPLRPFQQDDVPYFLSHKKSMILYEPRLGKTVVSCNVMALDPETDSILIACSKNAVSVWVDHIKTWFAYLQPNWDLDIRVVAAKGSTAADIRKALWKAPRIPSKKTIYICTFKVLLNDWDYLVTNKLHVFDTIIGDEVHKVLRSHKTKTHKVFKLAVKLCRRFHALSGTLVGKWGPADYFGLLNIINPREFSSYWAFLHTFCLVQEGMWGMEIVGVKNREQFHLLMSRFARFRDRKTYGSQMPTIQRDLIHVEMTPEQSRLFREIGKEGYAITDSGNLVIARNSLERMTRKRQLLTCPRILDPNMGLGGAFTEILERLEQAKEDEDAEAQHIVIFTAVRKAIEHFQRALVEAGYKVFVLAGGTEPEDLVRITAEFRKTKGIMLCTSAFAQAFSLDSARVCYHIGWDFDPNNNKQAEDRLVAQQGDYQINSYYYAYTDTDDDWLAHRITQQSQLMYLTNKDPRQFIKGQDPIDPLHLTKGD
jgi:SNF2 family DNA or RNA helicase